MVDIYKKYLPLAGESAMHYNIAHIVWDDENFERHHIEYCLNEATPHYDEDGNGHSPAQVEWVRESLRELLKLPDSILVPRPDFDDSPDEAVAQDYPPPPGMTMERH